MSDYKKVVEQLEQTVKELEEDIHSLHGKRAGILHAISILEFDQSRREDCDDDCV